jgi:small subunit ribosomal protein S16
MALKIKLARFGAVHKPIYRVVIAEARSRRDGASVEQIGSYQPRRSDVPLSLDLARIDYWMSKGAIPTDTVKGLIKRARRAAPPAPAPVAEAPAPAPAAPPAG